MIDTGHGNLEKYVIANTEMSSLALESGLQIIERGLSTGTGDTPRGDSQLRAHPPENSGGCFDCFRRGVIRRRTAPSTKLSDPEPLFCVDHVHPRAEAKNGGMFVTEEYDARDFISKQ